MEISLNRKHFLQRCTIGDLIIDGKFICFILEDVVRDTKVQGQTAIPYGRYKIIINKSERFSKIASKKAGAPVIVLLPLLLNVPNFSGIRIHPGNTEVDTDGCLLPGLTKNIMQQFVGESRAAFEKVFALISNALTNGEEVWITISREIP